MLCVNYISVKLGKRERHSGRERRGRTLPVLEEPVQSHRGQTVGRTARRAVMVTHHCDHSELGALELTTLCAGGRSEHLTYG